MYRDLELALAPPAPPALVAALSRVPGLNVRRDHRRSSLRHGPHEWELKLVTRPATDDDAQLIESITRREADEGATDVLPVVVASTLPRSLRRELAERRISYLDARGHVHLRAADLFMYVDTPFETTAPPSGRSSGLGLVGIRAVQVLATAPDHDWTVAELAMEADVSVGEANKVLTVLEREQLIESHGRGPSKRRRIQDPGSILDWLADQPRARRVYRHLACSLYARTPADLARRASRSLDASETPHAFTAGLAAMLLGSGSTSVPRSILRIDPDRSLEAVAHTLEAAVTERGANLILWSDDGLVGTHGRNRHGDTWVAPPVRVYLDLLADRRGADAAAHFREVTLGT